MTGTEHAAFKRCLDQAGAALHDDSQSAEVAIAFLDQAFDLLRAQIEAQAPLGPGGKLMQAFRKRFGRRYSLRDQEWWRRRGRGDEAAAMLAQWQELLFRHPKEIWAGSARSRAAYRSALHWLRHWREKVNRPLP